jgi:hypothetical protein
MKIKVIVIALVALALVVAGTGVVLAQDSANPIRARMHDGSGPLHTFMVTEFAKKLNLNVNDVNTRLAAGETLRDITLSEGVAAADFPIIMQEVRANALAAAVDANVITQEQADWMLTRGFGQGGGMYGKGNGDCDGTGPHGNRGNGSGMHGQGRGGQNGQSNP